MQTLIDIERNVEKILNHVHIMYGLLFLLMALLLNGIYVLSNIIAEVLYYVRY